jgi:hypothetical protein
MRISGWTTSLGTSNKNKIKGTTACLFVCVFFLHTFTTFLICLIRLSAGMTQKVRNTSCMGLKTIAFKFGKFSFDKTF